MWKMRDLSVIGRIQIVKTFLISQFQYLFGVFTIPEKNIKDIISIIFNYIWNSTKDKIKRDQIVKSIEKGGLSAPHLKAMILTSRINWIKKYHIPEHKFWKVTWRYNMQKLCKNPDLLWYCNFEQSSLPLDHVQDFYKEIIQSWIHLKGKEWDEKGDRINQMIWYNKFVKVKQKVIYWNEFQSAGIWTLGDLFNKDGSLIPFQIWQKRGIFNYLKWRALITIANQLKRDCDIQNCSRDKDIIFKLDVCYLNKRLLIAEVNSHVIYQCLLENIVGNEVINPRICKFVRCEKDWKEVYLLPYHICIDVRSRLFQFKFLNDILANNYWLKKWNIQEHDHCTFCKTNTESLIHLFWSCLVVQDFWENISTTIRLHTGLDLALSIEKICFCDSKEPDIINMVIIQAKRYLYGQRFKGLIPKVAEFRIFLANYSKIELYIAKKTDKMHKYIEKWNSVTRWLTMC